MVADHDIRRHVVEQLGDKTELVALNKIDALDPDTRKAQAKALKKACGHKIYEISGVSGEGVTVLLRAAFAEVQARRLAEGRPEAEDVEGAQAPVEGWRP